MEHELGPWRGPGKVSLRRDLWADAFGEDTLWGPQEPSHEARLPHLRGRKGPIWFYMDAIYGPRVPWRLCLKEIDR